MSAEEALNELGIYLEVMENSPVDPDVWGHVRVLVVDSEFDVDVSVRPGLVGRNRMKFAEWALSRIKRFAEHGPEPDGWRYEGDGRWHLWGALRYLGIDPFLDE
ncbi:hypothetical protein ACFWFQ_32815 [Nocardia salmonicida]|uniref:hypothetical protein n=1 Tax=Nocardia salmonicida TaxID=53431 RepID=UPI00365FBE65